MAREAQGSHLVEASVSLAGKAEDAPQRAQAMQEYKSLGAFIENGNVSGMVPMRVLRGDTLATVLMSDLSYLILADHDSGRIEPLSVRIEALGEKGAGAISAIAETLRTALSATNDGGCRINLPLWRGDHGIVAMLRPPLSYAVIDSENGDAILRIFGGEVHGFGQEITIFGINAPASEVKRDFTRLLRSPPYTQYTLTDYNGHPSSE